MEAKYLQISKRTCVFGSTSSDPLWHAVWEPLLSSPMVVGEFTEWLELNKTTIMFTCVISLRPSLWWSWCHFYSLSCSSERASKYHPAGNNMHGITCYGDLIRYQQGLEGRERNALKRLVVRSSLNSKLKSHQNVVSCLPAANSFYLCFLKTAFVASVWAV